jgi:transposase
MKTNRLDLRPSAPPPPPPPPDPVVPPHGHPDRHPSQLMRPRRHTPLVLSAQEQAELERLSRRQAAPWRAVERARIILLAGQEMTVPAIAATLQVCANTVRKWVGRYTHQPLGTPTAENPAPQPAAVAPPPAKLSRLADAHRSGRPDTFTAEQTCTLIALACERPEDHGRPITHWSARELRDQTVQAGIVPSISVRQVNRLLAAIDLQPHRSRYWLNAKPDPQKHDKIRALCQVYHQAPAAARHGQLTFSVDEMTGIQALARIAPDHPMQPGQPVRREFEYERHGTLSLLAGMNVATGQIRALCRPTRTEIDFVDLIDDLVQAHPQAHQFTFVLDNLNTHQSESLVRYVARDAALREIDLGTKGKEGVLQTQVSRASFLNDPSHRIHFCYTPKHASWMNQIEIWFGILARKVIRRGNFTSLADLQQRLEAFVDYFNRTMAKPFKWTYQGKPLQGSTSG